MHGLQNVGGNDGPKEGGNEGGNEGGAGAVGVTALEAVEMALTP